MISPDEQYRSYIAGADANDRRRFDAFLLGYLLHAVGPSVLTDALRAAAADVNGAAS